MIFAPNDQLLLIASGKRTRGQRRVGGPHIESLDDLVGPPLNRAFVEKDVAGIRGDRRPVVHAEDRILRETEIEQEPATVAIFRYVRDAELSTPSRADTVDVLAAEDRFSC